MTSMQTTPPVTTVAPSAARSKGRRFSGPRQTLGLIREAHGIGKFMLWSGIVLSTLFVLTALLAPWISPYDFDTYQDGGERFPKLGEPSGTNTFGTTVQSLDVLSRVIWGARTALEVMVLAVVFSLIVGVLLGLVSGFFGGWLDRILVLIMDTLFAFPYLLLAIVAAFMFQGLPGGGVLTTAIAITVVYIPQYFRVVRASTLSAREAMYVEAARAIGAKPGTIMRRYIFGNVIQSVPVITTVNAADALSTLAGLGFLGFGIQPTEAAEWGYDVSRALTDINADIWWTATFPCVAIVLAILGFTLLGEGLNDVLNPTMRRRKISKVIIPALTKPRTVVTVAAVPAQADAPAAESTETEAEPAAADGAESTETAETAETAGSEQPQEEGK
ncbi:ABC transporter permease [Yinghuangia seranimata]|uniref:ABC transporter permease n=1 Tax=Yinghuangia seranimata TaxID=408067 RepID=UPI00248BAA71|nr:ABC transporter permease [Yinghuangia seranimata]MDI2131574.1 ABC transporter permease [Yinghuangia seranimata]